MLTPSRLAATALAVAAYPIGWLLGNLLGRANAARCHLDRR